MYDYILLSGNGLSELIDEAITPRFLWLPPQKWLPPSYGRRRLRRRGLAFDRGWGPASVGTGGPSLDQMMKQIRMDHYENIFEAFFLPARTITKIFSKRFFCPHGPLRKNFQLMGL